MKTALLLSFLFTNIAAFASFEDSKQAYLSLKKEYESKVAQVIAERDLETFSLRQELSALELQRENCPSVQCAQTLDAKISELHDVIQPINLKWQPKIDALADDLVEKGDDLALQALFSEIKVAVEGLKSVYERPLKILSVTFQNECPVKDKTFTFQDWNGLGYHVFQLGENVVCQGAVVEYRMKFGERFEFGRVHFALMIESKNQPRHLDEIFSNTRDQFLFPRGKGDEILRDAFSRYFEVGTAGTMGSTKNDFEWFLYAPRGRVAFSTFNVHALVSKGTFSPGFPVLWSSNESRSLRDPGRPGKS